MNNDAVKILFVIISTIFLSLIFCGCATTVDNNESDIDFKSDIVNLLEHNIEFTTSRENIIVQATVTGTIQNKLDRILDIEIKGEFYDEDNNYLGQKTFYILGLREKDKIGHKTDFTIIYDEKNSNRIDHVKVTAIEDI